MNAVSADENQRTCIRALNCHSISTYAMLSEIIRGFLDNRLDKSYWQYQREADESTDTKFVFTIKSEIYSC